MKWIVEHFILFWVYTVLIIGLVIFLAYLTHFNLLQGQPGGGFFCPCPSGVQYR